MTDLFVDVVTEAYARGQARELLAATLGVPDVQIPEGQITELLDLARKWHANAVAPDGETNTAKPHPVGVRRLTITEELWSDGTWRTFLSKGVRGLPVECLDEGTVVSLLQQAAYEAEIGRMVPFNPSVYQPPNARSTVETAQRQMFRANGYDLTTGQRMLAARIYLEKYDEIGPRAIGVFKLSETVPGGAEAVDLVMTLPVLRFTEMFTPGDAYTLMVTKEKRR